MPDTKINQTIVENKPCPEPPEDNCDQPVVDEKDDCKCKKYTIILNFN